MTDSIFLDKLSRTASSQLKLACFYFPPATLGTLGPTPADPLSHGPAHTVPPSDKDLTTPRARTLPTPHTRPTLDSTASSLRFSAHALRPCDCCTRSRPSLASAIRVTLLASRLTRPTLAHKPVPSAPACIPRVKHYRPRVAA